MTTDKIRAKIRHKIKRGDEKMIISVIKMKYNEWHVFREENLDSVFISEYRAISYAKRLSMKLNGHENIITKGCN